VTSSEGLPAIGSHHGCRRGKRTEREKRKQSFVVGFSGMRQVLPKNSPLPSLFSIYTLHVLIGATLRHKATVRNNTLYCFTFVGKNTNKFICFSEQINKGYTTTFG